MRRFNPREAKRMMDKMGIDANEMPDVKEVVFRTSRNELVVHGPTVTMLNFQGQRMFQVLGERVEERELGSVQSATSAPKVSEEDVQIVSLQANVSPNEAKAALEESRGDLAQAILLLNSRKR
ncbi:MAG: nascent polypeptide-associated complex protein [Candidatus Bathyarchaeia archaeon]